MNISVKEFIDNYASILGVGYDSKCAYELINKARFLAYPLGDWVGTMAYMGFNASKGMMVLDSDMDFIRGARSGHGIVEIDVGHVTKEVYCGCKANPIISKRIGRVYSPFQSTENSVMFAYAVNQKDEGKELRIQYESAKGTKYDETISLIHLQPTFLINKLSKITRISKPVTSGAIAIALGPDHKNPIAIAHISAGDMNPVYNQYCFPCSGCLALEVKKRMIPYSIESMDDVLDIHPEAMSLFISAIKSKDSNKEGWQKDYSASVSLAVNFLRQEQINEDATNDAQITVQFHDYGFNELVHQQSI